MLLQLSVKLTILKNTFLIFIYLQLYKIDRNYLSTKYYFYKMKNDSFRIING